MRFALIALMFCACGVACGSDAAPAPVSVLNHGQAAPAAAMTAAPAVAAAPAAETIVVAEPVVVAKARCRNNRCCTGPDCTLYNVEESNSESCRRLLFGGYVKKNTSRTVYRPTRR